MDQAVYDFLAEIDQIYNAQYILKLSSLYLTKAGFEGNQKKAIRFTKYEADNRVRDFDSGLVRVVKLVRKFCGAV